jgi:PAS domain S-box-containing protein
MRPAEPSTRAALAILAEIAGFLSASRSVEEVLTGVVGALKRGTAADACRIWIRAPDGTNFYPVSAPGDREAPSRATDVRAEAFPDWSAADPYVRAPLVYQGERFGLLECRLPTAAGLETWREIVATVANILAPLLSTIELSQDLAGEVALRTREIESQRRFTSKIIDSLPVGLYVIDRDYRIQAWNRKRETGTQGIARDDALGRTVFEVLHRQPRDLLVREFDHVFATGEIEEVEVQTETRSGPRYYRIRKIPMRLDEDRVSHVITRSSRPSGSWRPASCTS